MYSAMNVVRNETPAEPDEQIGTLYQQTINSKEIARKSLDNIDSYLEAAECAHRAAGLSAERAHLENNITLAFQHEVFSAYYSYEEHDCLSGYYYEKRNTELGKQHADYGKRFIKNAIDLLENIPPA